MRLSWWIQRFTPFTQVWRWYGPGYWWYCLRHGLKNLVVYAPVVWGQEDFDYAYLLELMAFKMRRMARLHRYHGHLVKAPRKARELDRCACICERLARDDFNERDGDHLEYLTTTMNKHLLHWWD